jgi:hypothetical protein
MIPGLPLAAHLAGSRGVKYLVNRLQVAGEAGIVKLGNVSTDGTNIQGNASRHRAMSYGSMRKEADRLAKPLRRWWPRRTSRTPRTIPPWGVDAEAERQRRGGTRNF